MMRATNLVTAASAILLIALIWPAHAQLADNLMVSGSDRPMAEGVGTYGLKGAGTQGVSGQSQAGGLYSARIPTFTLSKNVPGVIVSDGDDPYIHSFHILSAAVPSSGHRVRDSYSSYETRCRHRDVTNTFW